MPNRKQKPRKTQNRSPKRSARPQNFLPRGFRMVTPYLTVDRGEEALAFYQRAFGARELLRQLTPDGKLVHGRLRFGDSIVMVSDAFPGSSTRAPRAIGGTTVTLHLYCRDVDAAWTRALAAGATVEMPLENQFWGERYGQLSDPYGHHWSLSQRVRIPRGELEAKRRDAMASFSQGEHPSSGSQAA